MKDITVKEAESDHKLMWDSFIKKNEESTPYLLFDWKRVISSSYGHRSSYLMALSTSGEVKGVLPSIEIRRGPFGSSFTSIPFFDVGGVCTGNREIEPHLLNRLFYDGNKRNIHSIALRMRNNIYGCERIKTNLYPFYHVVSEKVEMILPLKETSQDMLASFKSKLRSQIKRPKKAGLIIQEGRDDLLNDFYSVFSQNMKALGSPVHKKEFIKNTLELFPQNTRVFVVYKEKIPLAGAITFGFKETLYNPWASSLREYSRLSPNMLLYWGMLKHGCDEGYSFFNFGRSTRGEGTYRFKKQWGAKESPLLWHIWSRKKIKSKGKFKSSKFKSLFIRGWKRLPLSIANFLGPRIRGYIDL